MKKTQNMQVGEAVYFSRQDKVGLVYTTYERGANERPGVQVLLADGTDLSGFSAEEADQFLQSIGDTGLDYEFTHVGQLHQDYKNGVFGQAFHNAQVFFITYSLCCHRTD